MANLEYENCVEGSKRREVLTAKDEKPVNLLNLLNLQNLLHPLSRAIKGQHAPKATLA